MNKEKIREIMPTIIYLAAVIFSGFYCYAGMSIAQSNLDVFIIAGFTMIILFLAGIEYHLNQRK